MSGLCPNPDPNCGCTDVCVALVAERQRRGMSDPTLQHRIQTELREVAKLLEAAEQIADGLVDVLTHAYDHDGRTKNALAAANQLAVVLHEERLAAEERCS